ncbi:MAG: RNA polymerase sigma factor [Actinomycetota bacterium]
MEGAGPEYTWFFRAEFPMVLRTVFLILGDRARAEDVTQEAFIQLLSHWKKVSRYERPEAWVRRVAIRLAVRTLKRDRMRAVLERDTAPERDPRWPDVDLAEALKQLPVKQRTCVLLFYFEDRPIAEIVEILGISEGAVKVHLHRARERLATLLGEEVDEDAR